MRNKKAWLDKLYYDLGKQQYDYELCTLQKTEDGERKSTKWRKYSEIVFPVDFDGSCEDKKIWWLFKTANQRTILPIEVVLDLEEPKRLNEIIQKLKSFNLTFYVFETGSKGYHISIFFKEELTAKKKLAIIKYFGCDIQKNSDRTMIQLENEQHWRGTGRIKREVKTWKR